MDFGSIAEYLNIPEDVVVQLARRGVLPGTPSVDGWDVEMQELERWYVGLTGRAWADLVSDGDVAPLVAELALPKGYSIASIIDVLQSSVTIDIQSLATESSDTLVAEFNTKGPTQSEEQMIASAKARVGTRRVEGLETDIQCQRLLSQHKLTLAVSEGHKCRLSLENDLVDLPERDRELIRHKMSLVFQEIIQGLRSRTGRLPG